MPTYLLMADHYINDRIIPAGTKIGDGTPFPFNGEPTPQMQGDDDASRELIEKKFGGLRTGVEALDINGNPPSGGGSDDEGTIPMVGEQPGLGQGGDNPIFPSRPPQPEQPVPPYAVEQVAGSSVARVDESLSVEDRQQAADATATAAHAGGAPEVAPPEGNQTEAEPVKIDPVPASAPTPTVSGKSIDSILKS